MWQKYCNNPMWPDWTGRSLNIVRTDWLKHGRQIQWKQASHLWKQLHWIWSINTWLFFEKTIIMLTVFTGYPKESSPTDTDEAVHIYINTGGSILTGRTLAGLPGTWKSNIVVVAGLRCASHTNCSLFRKKYVKSTAFYFKLFLNCTTFWEILTGYSRFQSHNSIFMFPACCF